MGLPFPENLTPDAPPYSTVQINEYWWSVIFGFGDAALIRKNWDVTDQQWEDEVKPAIINALDTAMNCDCIVGLSFDPVTGKLTYTDEDSNTVTVMTAGDTFVTNNYYVITANEADADDAYCYAAHMLSERMADDLQDMLEVVDVLEDATVSAFLILIASTVDLVPLFGDATEAVIRITDNLAEAMYDWVKDNIRDIQARQLAAEIFYCGIKAAMENGGQSSLRAEIIAAGGALLKQLTFSFIDGLWEIPDLFDVFEDAFDALDGEALGYAIVAYFLLTDVAMETFGTDRPIEAIIAHATQNAAAHDSRDCAGFCDGCPFSHDWSLLGNGEGDWIQAPDFLMGEFIDDTGWKSTTGFFSGFWRTGVRIQWDDETIPELTEIHFTVNVTDFGNQNVAQIIIDHDGGTDDIILDTTSSLGVNLHAVSGSWDNVTKITYLVQLNGSSVSSTPDGECFFGGTGGTC